MNYIRQEEHRRAVHDACMDEMTRFNAALAAGKTAILHTAFGPYYVCSVDTDWWYRCSSQPNSLNMFDQRSFAGCNNESWACLMDQVGEPRNPLFNHLMAREYEQFEG